MFKVKENKEIGEYLKGLISRQYDSVSQFCRDYLDLKGGKQADEDHTYLRNRFSQILNGKKGLQVYDLPYCCELLQVSCEQILSCGNCFKPISGHVTNYEIAFSDDEKIWEEYMNREDNLFLNPDEYGKSVLDYALEFRNYGFLKYLVENGYIWFSENGEGWEDKGYRFGFIAGTSVKRRGFMETDSFVPEQLVNEDRLRTQLVVLAIENEDFDMIEELRGRKIPPMGYLAHKMLPGICTVDYSKYRNTDLIASIAHSGRNVLEYFSREFDVTNDSNQKNRYVFPYLSDVVEIMLQEGNADVKVPLKNAIDHNKNFYNRLKSLIEDTYQDYLKKWGPAVADCVSESGAAQIQSNFQLDENKQLAAFPCFSVDGIVSNIIHVNNKSGKPDIDEMVAELNDWHQKIVDLKKWRKM